MTRKRTLTATPNAEHDCGLCDAPLVFDGMDGEYESWRCSECDWWHTSKDCCMGHLTPEVSA